MSSSSLCSDPYPHSALRSVPALDLPFGSNENRDMLDALRTESKLRVTIGHGQTDSAFTLGVVPLKTIPRMCSFIQHTDAKAIRQT